MQPSASLLILQLLLSGFDRDSSFLRTRCLPVNRLTASKSAYCRRQKIRYRKYNGLLLSWTNTNIHTLDSTLVSAVFLSMMLLCGRNTWPQTTRYPVTTEDGSADDQLRLAVMLELRMTKLCFKSLGSSGIRATGHRQHKPSSLVYI